MFDIGATELLLIAIVALVVIGPKDLPRVMRTIGHWVGKARATTRHFRSGIDAMIREAELEEEQKKWAEMNARIMREHPASVVEASAVPSSSPSPSGEGLGVGEVSPSKPLAVKPRLDSVIKPATAKSGPPTLPPDSAEPEFGFDPPKPQGSTK